MLKENVVHGVTITYPGLRVVQKTPNYFNLFIWQPDSRDRELPLHERRGWDQWASAWIPKGTPPEQVKEKIFSRIKTMLTHELKENLYADGEPIHTTHSNGLSEQSQSVMDERRTGMYLDVLLHEHEH